MLLPALYGVWFPNLCETFESAVDMRAQPGEDGLALLLGVDSPALLVEHEMEQVQLGDVSMGILSVFGQPPFGDLRQHLFDLVVFPACPLCGSAAAPFLFRCHERLHDHDLHDCHAVLLQSHQGHAMSLQDHRPL